MTTKNFIKKLITASLALITTVLFCSGCDFAYTYSNSGKVSEEIDYQTLINTITTSKIRANITVTTHAYNTLPFGIIESDRADWLGSGVIFYEDDDNYYFLTNNHVTYPGSKYKRARYYCEDYLGNKCDAQLIYSDADYDLALMSCEKSVNLTVLSLAQSNPEIGDEVISVGQPKGQANAITFGKVIKYTVVELSDATAAQSNVTFQVMQHNSPTAKGNSGGAILDTDLHIAGIHYAGSVDEQDNFIAGFAIPVIKIYEFLQKANFDYYGMTDTSSDRSDSSVSSTNSNN